MAPYAYYNEIDERAVAWLHELKRRRLIPDGVVDSRSIWDVYPEDLDDFTHCHFFAGIGGWALALQLAGWPLDRPIWTGSCPCQPFSSAGKGAGFADERHLWPAWHHLISIQRPPVVAGEQVEAAINHGWLDLVHDDLEGEGYAVATVGLPAASVGTPQRRQRLWFVADTDRTRRGTRRTSKAGNGCDASRVQPAGLRPADILAHTNYVGPQGRQREKLSECPSERVAGPRSTSGKLGYTDRYGVVAPVQRPQFRRLQKDRFESIGSSPLGGPWRDAEWLRCADHKLRPVEPGTFPLAHGVPARVGRLRGYGNAIVPQVAAEVISACMDLLR